MPSEGVVQVFQAPVLFKDLRQTEALLQICDALENLDRIVQGVFGAIRDRMSNEQKRLNDIITRTKAAEAKVNLIGSSMQTRATTVFAPNKYPAKNTGLDYVSIYSDLDRQPPMHSRYHLSNVPHLPAMAPRDPINESTVLSELSRERGKTGENQEWEGLGRLPAHLPSVSSLMLFNTDENPYNVYVSIDNLLGTDAGPEKDDDDKIHIAEAPTSVALGENMPFLGMMEFRYRPTLSGVPEFNLPDSLPELGMFAGDLHWSSTNTFSSIAPSAEINQLPLPAVDIAALDGPPAISSLPAMPDTISASAVPPPPPPMSVSAGGAPPPPPPMNMPGPPPPPPPSAGPPPPGPPPPIANVPQEIAAPDQSRSSLLEQIRQGKQLKSAKRSRKEKKKKAEAASEEPKKTSGGMDIMDSLKRALTMRNKILSGKDDTSRMAPKDDGGADKPPIPRPNNEEEEWSD